MPSCGPNPMFFLIEGVGAKTIRGSNHSLNHTGILPAELFHWGGELWAVVSVNVEVHLTVCVF